MIIICHNTHSLRIAKLLLESNSGIIYANTNRLLSYVDGSTIKPLKLIKLIYVLIVGLISRREIVIPHTQSRFWLFKILIHTSKNLSLIDDGLDTFRLKPKNFSWAELRFFKHFYTFSYKLPIASWTRSLKIFTVGPFINQDIEGRFLDQGIEHLVIDSPGVSCHHLLPYLKGKIGLLPHPAVGKRTVLKGPQADKVDYYGYLEGALKSYAGTIHVGESMLLVFLLELESNNHIVKPYSFTSFENYSFRKNLARKVNDN